MENGFGKARYGSTSSYKKRQTLKPGSNIKRVLPPFGSLAARGMWAFWVPQHFGWNGVNKNDPDKPMVRPFRCIKRKNFKTGIIEQECEACNEIDRKKAELEALEAELKANKKSEKEIKVELEPYNKWIKDHNIDKKWYMNTMLENGDFELTAISNTCKQRLDELFKKVSQKYGVDPIDVDAGVWVDFRRILPASQNLRDADDVTEVVMEMVTVEKSRMEQLKLAPLTEDVLSRAVLECVDLPKQFTEISESQIEAIVASSGDPEEIDQIFGLAQPNNQEKSPEPVKTVAKAPVSKVKPPETTSSLGAKAPKSVEPPAEDNAADAPTEEPVAAGKKASKFAAMFGE